METRDLLNKKYSWLVPAIIIIIAALLRLVPHAPNFTPIAAIALFGGVYLNKKLALAIPVLAMLLSDFLIGFHQSMPYVYFSLILTGLIGMYIKKRRSVASVLVASLVSSVLFYLITNFGYWLSNSLYPKTLPGQLEAYYMALPFFRNTIVGDLFYNTILFGGYALLVKIFSKKELLTNKL